MYPQYQGSDCFTGWGGDNHGSSTVTMEVEELEPADTTALTKWGPEDGTDKGPVHSRQIHFQKHYPQSVLRCGFASLCPYFQCLRMTFFASMHTLRSTLNITGDKLVLFLQICVLRQSAVSGRRSTVSVGAASRQDALSIWPHRRVS